MSSFLTVEDVNSILCNYDYVNTYHKFDMSIVGDARFGYVDFIQFSLDEDRVNLSLRVDNSLWTGGFYIIKDGEPVKIVPVEDISVDTIGYSSSNSVLELEYALSNGDFRDVEIYLYLSSFMNRNMLSISPLPFIVDVSDNGIKEEANFSRTVIDEDIMPSRFKLKIQKDNVDTPVEILNTTNTGNSNWIRFTLPSNINGTFVLTDEDDTEKYLYGYIKRKMLIPLVIGATRAYNHTENNLKFMIFPDRDYNLESFVVEEVFVECNGVKTACQVDTGSYMNIFYYSLDLRDSEPLDKVKLTVTVPATEYSQEVVVDLNVNVTDYTVNTFAQLKQSLSKEAKMIIIGANITFNTDLLLDYPVQILSKQNNILNLGGHSILVDDNTNVNLTGLTLRNGSPLIVQSEGSTINLNDCIITDCIRFTDDATTASVIKTKITNEDIYIENNYRLNIIGCTIYNNETPFITYDGEIQIDNSKFHLTDDGLVDEFFNDYPSFLYLVDGACNITNTEFKIKLPHELSFNIGNQQSILLLGENAVINNQTTSELSNNDSLNLFNNTYGNTSYIYCNYYIESIKGNIIISPVPNKELNSCCHSLVGEIYIFKNNAQVTRGDWGTENTIDKMEDIE